MSTYILVTIIIASVWLFGAVLAIILMVLANVLVLDRDPKCEPYTRKEFVIGFFASWFTVKFVSETLLENL